MAGLSLGNILSAVKLASLLALVAALLWYRHDARSAHMAFDKLKAEYIADSQMAAYRQIAATQATEARYSALAAQGDIAHAKALESAHRASDSFIARQLRPVDQCAPGGTTAAAQGEGAGLPAVAAADAFVAVAPADVTACTDAAVYARSAHEWAASLLREGLGE